MLVADLQHYLDLPESTPGPARRLAEQLGDIVRAGTAGDVGEAWASALPCRRRPGKRACPGRMVVARPEPPGPIRWQCSACRDGGVISNWQDTPFDLRRRTPRLADPVRRFALSDEVAAALRDLLFLDAEVERAVYGMRAEGRRLVLAVSDEDLEELIGSVAAEANAAPNRRRQRRLDAALDVLTDAQAAHHR